MALTDKKKRFCDEYLIDFNGTQAAIRAGYSEKTANEQAARLLANVSIQEYLNEKKKKLAEKSDISLEKVLNEYAKIAFTDIRLFYNEDGSLKNVHQLSDEAAATLAGVETDDLFEGYGEERKLIGQTKKIKRWDKTKALDSICRVLGYNAPEKNEFSFNTEVTITIGDKKV